MRTRAGTLLALTALVVGCGKEVGRIPLSGEATSKATMTLAAGEVDFWTDLDLEFEGDAGLEYRVVLVQDDAPVTTTICDPLGRLSVKKRWLETDIGGSHARRGEGKMACSVKLAKGGPTTVEATLVASRRPSSLKIAKADLVAKQ